MQISATTVRRAVPALCALAVFGAPAAAGAAPATTGLRVEADNKPLAPGHSFVTDSVTVVTDTSAPCRGSGKPVRLNGPNALGLVADATDASRPVRPLQVTDRFSFGLLVCGIGGYPASDSAFWLYKVNHVSPEVGGDQQPVKSGDQVLWYFQDTTKGTNIGDELAIEAPARAVADKPFGITVVSYDFKGARTPAAGARVLFRGGSATTGADGRATISLHGDGYRGLRAVRAAPGGSDIPSAPVRVCVGDGCAPVRGQRITGRDVSDSVKGTSGRDVIRTRGGNDRVNVRGGRLDRVYCGSGRDVVRLSRRDRAARDCEVVLRG